jgi:hypothetical protein
MLLSEDSAQKQKTVHSFMACYVHVLLYNAAICQRIFSQFSLLSKDK